MKKNETIETIAPDKLQTVSGGFLGFGGAGNRFPVLRNWFGGLGGGAAAGGGGGCPGGQCPRQG